jgi:hypothetical protein
MQIVYIIHTVLYIIYKNTLLSMFFLINEIIIKKVRKWYLSFPIPPRNVSFGTQSLSFSLYLLLL